MLTFPGRWTAPGLCLLALAWLSRWLALGRRLATPLDLPICLLTIMVAVGVGVSSVPIASASKALGIVLGISLYYSLANRPDPDSWQRTALDALVLLGAAVAALALVGTDWRSVSLFSLPWLEGVYRRLPVLLHGLPGSGLPRAGDLFNPREVGGTLSLLLPLAAVPMRFSAEWGRLRRGAYGLAIVLMGGVLLLTQSISGIGGVLAALITVGLLVGRVRWRGWAVAGLLIGTAVAVASTAVWSRPAGAEASRRAALGMAARLELWPTALRVIHDTPYTGIGVNTFPWVMDRFYPAVTLGPEPHAHNFFLQTAVDLGLPGLVALLWILAGFAAILVRAYRASSGASMRTTILALAAALLSFLIFGSVDAITLGAKPGLAIWAVLGIGAALGCSAGDGVRGIWWPRWLAVAMGVALTAALVAPLLWSGPALNMGHILAYRAILPGDGEARERPGLIEARRWLEAAAKADPGNRDGWYLLASVTARLGDTEQALGALRQGVLADGGGADMARPQRLYARWIVRYPRRAEWYVAWAMIACESRGEREAAAAQIDRGLARDARPGNLLEAYGAALRGSALCGRGIGNG